MATEGGMYWVPVGPASQSVSVPKDHFDLGPNCSLAYLPARLVRVEGVSQNIGVFAVEWDSRQEVKCILGNAQERRWPEDEGKMPDHIDEVSVGNVASLVYAMTLRYQAGKCMSMMNGILLWSNPLGTMRHMHGFYQNRIDYMSEVLATSKQDMLEVITDKNVIYPLVERARVSALNSQNGITMRPQTIVFRGCSASGKSEAVKAAAQYLMYVDTMQSGDESNEKEEVLKALNRNSFTSKNHDGYSPLGSSRNPLLYDCSLAGHSLVQDEAGTPVHIHHSIAASLLLLDVMITRPSTYSLRSTRAVNRVKFVMDADSGRLRNFRVQSLLVDCSEGSFKAPEEMEGRKSDSPFLIFPMVLASMGPARSTEAGIPDKMRTAYIASCPAWNEKQLAAECSHFKSLLTESGLTESQWTDLERAVVGIVLLQSMSIVGNESAFIGGPSQALLVEAEKQLGASAGSLKEIILKNDAGRLGIMDHKPEGARGVRQSLCSAVYHRICACLSSSVSGSSFFQEMLTTNPLSDGDEATTPGTTFVELVDTMGYEQADVGAVGSLSTLVANYTAERFFFQFKGLSFDTIVSEYEADGVHLPNYVPPDVSWTVDLFDKMKIGLIGMTEDVCMSMRPDDKQIVDKFIGEYGKAKLVRPAGMKSKRSEFFVHHHFTDCLYDGEGFVKASKAPNAITTQIQKALNKSTVSIISEQAAGIMAAASDTDLVGKAADARQAKPGPKMGGVNRALQAKGLVLSRARDVLTKTLGTLENSAVTYVLCLRPNESPHEYHLDPKFMDPQVAHHLLEELHSLCTVGYRIKMPYASFYRKYCRAISPYSDLEQHPEDPGPADVGELLKICLAECVERGLVAPGDVAQYDSDKQGAECAQFGIEHVYYRASLGNLLDAFFNEKRTIYTTMSSKIGATYKSHYTWHKFRKLVRGAVLLAAQAKKMVYQRRFQRQRYLVSRMRANIYCRKQHRLYLSWKAAVNTIKSKLMSAGFFQDRLRFLNYQRCMLSLHMLVRGAHIKVLADKVMRQVVMLQHCAIRFVTKCRVFYRKTAAAIIVARYARGFIWRKTHPRSMLRLAQLKRGRLALRVTRVIQQRFRCRNIAKKFQELREASRVLQHWFRGRRARIRLLKAFRAIRWFQCSARRILASDKVSFMMAARMMRDEMERLRAMRTEEVSRIRNKGVLARIEAASAACLSPVRGIADGDTFRVSSQRKSKVSNRQEFAIGSGILRSGHTSYTDTLVAFDIFTDIGTAYPTGFLAPLIEHNDQLSQKQKYLVHTATGAGHTIMVDNDHQVYGFGLADGGELGNGPKDTRTRPRPVPLPFLQSKLCQDEMRLSKAVIVDRKSFRVQVKELACGREHTCLLSATGLLWTWGRNTRGQLGHSEFSTSFLPGLVVNTKGGHLRHIRSISSGAMHSACLDDRGILYTWGAYECLGREPPEAFTATMARGDAPSSGRGRASVYLSTNPEEQRSKRFTNAKRPDSSIAQPVAFFTTNADWGKFNVSHLVCGDSHVTVVAGPVLKTARVGIQCYSWGNNSYGQLGCGDRRCVLAFTPRRVTLPVVIDGINIKKPDHASTSTGVGQHMKDIQLATGGRHMLLLLQNEVWAWGWNKYGQLGSGSASSCEHSPVVLDGTKMHAHLESATHAKFLTTIQSVDAGWKVSSAVNSAGDVFLWGTVAFTSSGAEVSEESMRRAENEEIHKAIYGDIQGSYSSPSGMLGSQGEVDRSGIEAGHELTCLSEPTLVAVDEGKVGHPTAVVHYGNGAFTATALRGVDPAAKDWAASVSGATRSRTTTSPFRNAGSPVSATLSPEGAHITPFSPITAYSAGTKTPIVSPKRTAEINGRNPRETRGETLYRGANAIKVAEDRHRLVDQAIKERFELQKQDSAKKKTPAERSRSPHAAQAAKRQSIGPYSLSPPKAPEESPHRLHGPYSTTDDRGSFREVRPKLPHHHPRSDDKTLRNQHVRHGAHADEVLDAFRAAGLTRAFTARDSRSNREPSPPPPRSAGEPEAKEASPEKENGKKLGMTGRYHSASAVSPSSHLKDRATRLSRSTSISITQRSLSPTRSSTVDTLPPPGGKVTSEGMSALLSSQPRSRLGMQLDPSKPSVQILQRRARSRAKGLRIPAGARHLLLEDDKTSLLRRYGLRLQGEDAVDDPYGALQEEDAHSSKQHYLVNEEFASFVGEVINMDAQYDTQASQFEHSGDEDDDEDDEPTVRYVPVEGMEDEKTELQLDYDATRRAAYIKAAQADLAHALGSSALKSEGEHSNVKAGHHEGQAEAESELEDYLGNLRRELGVPPSIKIEREKPVVEAESKSARTKERLKPTQTTDGSPGPAKGKGKRDSPVRRRYGSYEFLSDEAQRGTQLGVGTDSIHLSSVRDLSSQINALRIRSLAHDSKETEGGFED